MSEKDDYHVVPANDLIEHIEEGSTCPCGPRVEEGRPGVFLYVHHSLDGREKEER